MTSKFTRVQEHKTETADTDLVKAIQIRCSRIFPAMNIANAFGGSQSQSWWLIRNFSLQEMLQEADRREVDLGEVEGCMKGDDPPLLVDCPLYKKIREQMAQPEGKEP